MERIGILAPIGDNCWIGGVNYFRSLLNALNITKSSKYEFYLLTNKIDLFANDYNKHIKIIYCKHLFDNRETIRNLSRALQTDIRLGYYAKKHKLSMLTHASPGTQLMPPTLFWMPDFQHCHLPHFFSDAQINNRDSEIIRAAERSGHLLLSSYAAEKDFRLFYPQLGYVKTHILRFVPLIDTYAKQGVLCSEARNVDEVFFFLPNQFWVHKNHIVVIEALNLLPKHIKVICTGSLNDYRNVEHIENLQLKIKELGLEERFVILGLVEREEMLSLMARAIAVINPSLFEGWSTTVEEAKYMGKRMVLSNLPVHFEQNPPDSYYFNPVDHHELAGYLLDIIESYDVKKDMNRAKVARQKYHGMGDLFAKNYINIIESIIE